MSSTPSLSSTPILQIHSLLKENPTLLDKTETLQLIKNILQNIVNRPHDDKFRCIKLSNPKLSEKIVQVKGALDILMICRFTKVKENNEEFIKLSHDDVDVEVLGLMKKIIETYEQRRELLLLPNNSTSTNNISNNNNNNSSSTTTATTSPAFVLDESYSIILQFRNSQHQVVEEMNFGKEKYQGHSTLAEVVFPRMEKRLRELNWPGFALYAQHEPVYRHTTLDDLNYQRKNQTLILQCEDHNCQYRAVLVPVIEAEECVVCFEPLDNGNRTGGLCMHRCACKTCFKMLDKCPICRKTIDHTNNNRGRFL